MLVSDSFVSFHPRHCEDPVRLQNPVPRGPWRRGWQQRRPAAQREEFREGRMSGGVGRADQVHLGTCQASVEILVFLLLIFCPFYQIAILVCGGGDD